MPIGVAEAGSSAWLGQYPITLVRAFAAALRLTNGNLAGLDPFEATLFPLPGPITPKPQVRAVYVTFETYTVDSPAPGCVGGRLYYNCHRSTRTATPCALCGCSRAATACAQGSNRRTN